MDRPPRTAILYGPLLASSFRDLHTFLFSQSRREHPHLEYIVRPIPPVNENNSERNHLSGYGVSLDLKKTDYLAVDDRQARQTRLCSSLKLQDPHVTSFCSIVGRIG